MTPAAPRLTEARTLPLWAGCLAFVLLLHLSLLLVWNRHLPAPHNPAPPAVLIDLAPPAPAPQPPKPLATPKPPPLPLAPTPEPPKPVPLNNTPNSLPLLRPRHHKTHRIRERPPPASAALVTPAPPPTPSPTAEPTKAAPAAHPAAAPSGAASQDWRVRVLTRLEQFKFYPEQATERGWQGETLLRLTIRRDGSVVSMSVISSSGHAVLDEAALQTLRDADPLPAPPPEIPGALITLTLPLGFSLADQ